MGNDRTNTYQKGASQKKNTYSSFNTYSSCIFDNSRSGCPETVKKVLKLSGNV